MRLGYSAWGFLGDVKLDTNKNELSTPDGNSTYSWSIIHEAQSRGWDVYWMQEDRDHPGYTFHGKSIFNAFSQTERAQSYINLIHTQGKDLPELDVLLLEWRFPINGRNVDFTDRPLEYYYDKDKHQPDFARQCELLYYYKAKGTKIIIWDLDHKLTTHNEKVWEPDAIFETSHSPLKQHIARTRVEPPFLIKNLLEHTTLPQDTNRALVYIGSRYERDDVITEWIKPISEHEGVEFHGNWLKTVDECKKLWPDIKYFDRCTVKDFRRIYGAAMAVPLLAKKSYLETGFITPRPWEALLFGSIPLGLSTHKGIEQYCLKEMIVRNSNDMRHLMKWMKTLSVKARDAMRRKNVEQLEFMDAKYFVDHISQVVHK